ncbi:MarR family transcriptional regulator [Novacetimonas hansenii]|nr:MarR family transcriptional regulator [Novacetimonas hansenii]
MSMLCVHWKCLRRACGDAVQNSGTPATFLHDIEGPPRQIRWSIMSVRSPMPDLEGSGFQDMRITFLMMRLSNTWRLVLDRAIRPEGMSMAMMRPLAYLMMMPDGVSQRDLAQAMNTDSSALVRVLDLLEKEGLVERRPDPVDRRVKSLFLTPGGKHRCARLHEICAELEGRLLCDIPTDMMGQTVHALSRILRYAEMLSQEENEPTSCTSLPRGKPSERGG